MTLNLKMAGPVSVMCIVCTIKKKMLLSCRNTRIPYLMEDSEKGIRQSTNIMFFRDYVSWAQKTQLI